MTGANAKIKKIYVGTQQVRPVWKPGLNTKIYLPLQSDLKDYSGNNRDGTITGSGTTEFKNNGIYLPDNSIQLPSPGALSIITISMWFYVTGKGGEDTKSGCYYRNDISKVGTYLGSRVNDTQVNPHFGIGNGSSISSIWSLSNLPYNTWIHILGTYDGNNGYFYINGNLNSSGNNVSSSPSNNANYTWYINGANNGTVRIQGIFSKFIVEDKYWTAQDVLDYYNQTKSNYGL